MESVHAREYVETLIEEHLVAAITVEIMGHFNISILNDSEIDFESISTFGVHFDCFLLLSDFRIIRLQALTDLLFEVLDLNILVEMQ